jgi:hypothetical protein
MDKVYKPSDSNSIDIYENIYNYWTYKFLNLSFVNICCLLFVYKTRNKITFSIL